MPVRNPIQSPVLAQPFTPQPGAFMPRQNGNNAFAGNVAPQGGYKPLNSDVSAPRGQSNDNGGYELTSTWSDVLNAQPKPVLPYVPPSTSGIVNNMLGMHENYANASLPLLDMLLSEIGNRTGITQQYFQPEMALRGGMNDLLASQNNDLLKELLGLQEQMSKPQQSGAFYFAGF